MLEFLYLKKFKNRKIRRRIGEDIEPQEVLMDRLAQRKEKQFGLSEQKFEVPFSKQIFKGLFVFVAIMILFLFGKTFQLQVLDNKEFSEAAEKNKFIVYSLKSDRGVVYDIAGTQLVFNKPSFDLVLDKRNLPEAETEKRNVLKEVSDIIGKSSEDLENMINEAKSQTILVSENLDYQTLILLETKIEELPG